MTLIPEGLSLLAATGLVGLSFLASLVTAAIGLGGGVMMLAAVASLVPAAAIIPVHGVVQIGSNAGRALIMLKDIDRRIAGLAIAGGIVGAFAGGLLVVEIPKTTLLVIIGLFILQSVWLPLPQMSRLGAPGLAVGGAISSFLTMFLGATGPFIAAFTRPVIPAKETFVATHATIMTVQHSLKIVVFGMLGFAFAPWLPLLAAMIGAGFLGTIVGRRILLRLPEKAFATGLKIVLTLAALRLIVLAVTG